MAQRWKAAVFAVMLGTAWTARAAGNWGFTASGGLGVQDHGDFYPYYNKAQGFSGSFSGTVADLGVFRRYDDWRIGLHAGVGPLRAEQYDYSTLSGVKVLSETYTLLPLYAELAADRQLFKLGGSAFYLGSRAGLGMLQGVYKVDYPLIGLQGEAALKGHALSGGLLLGMRQPLGEKAEAAIEAGYHALRFSHVRMSGGSGTFKGVDDIAWRDTNGEPRIIDASNAFVQGRISWLP